MDILYALLVQPFLDMYLDPLIFIETVIKGLMAGVLYSLVALGFVLIFKASGVFNFAQGVMALFAALTLTGVMEYIPDGLPKWLIVIIALCITIVIMILLAVIIERIVLETFSKPGTHYSLHGHAWPLLRA